MMGDMRRLNKTDAEKATGVFSQVPSSHLSSSRLGRDQAPVIVSAYVWLRLGGGCRVGRLLARRSSSCSVIPGWRRNSLGSFMLTLGYDV